MDYTTALEQWDEIIALLKSDGKVSNSYALIINAVRNKLVQGAGDVRTNKKAAKK